jgi:hypothetical protein
MTQVEPPPELDEGTQKALALHLRYGTKAKALTVTAFVDGEERALTYRFEIEDVLQAIGRLLSWVAGSQDGSVMMVELPYLELSGNHATDEEKAKKTKWIEID